MKRPVVALTRARGENDAVRAALEAAGIEGREYPALRYQTLAGANELGQALTALRAKDWLVVTSARVIAYLDSTEVALPLGVRVASVGPATSAALRASGYGVDFEAATQTGVGLARDLLRSFEASQVLLPRSALGGRELVETLTSGGWQVHDLPLYAPHPDTEGIHELARAGLRHELDGLALASPSAFLNILSLMPPPAREMLARVKLFSIGPATTSVIGEAGYTVAAQASPHTLESLTECMIRCFNQSQPASPSSS